MRHIEAGRMVLGLVALLAVSCGKDKDEADSATPPAESCTNGEDDDGDSFVDCADTDCDDDSDCATTPPDVAEDCDNGRDEDEDGFVDCDDPDCAGDPACDTTGPGTEGDCDDGIDDDGDTLVDCDDEDCAGDPACDTGGTPPVVELDCADGIDDDGDLAIDCDDSDCAVAAVCLPEANCVDGLDNDADLAFDCADADCAAAPVCLPEANCADGLDDDSDLAIDCADADCAADAACAAPLPEANCADGIDDDGDLAIDCDDADCAADATCILLACADDILSGAVPSQYLGTTSASGDDTVGSCAGAANDFALQFTAPADGTYAFDTIGSPFDTVLYVTDGCGGELACNDDIELGINTDSALTVDLLGGQTVIVVVDGFSALDAGNFILHANEILGTETSCTNGNDDDGDFLVDCVDTDCDGDPLCVETDCANFFDDEGDGLVDCSDSDCFADANCFEDCGNQIDDNGDAFTDCQAPSCLADAVCAVTCPELSLGSVVPGVVSGTTLGLGDEYHLTCAASGFPTVSSDATVEFTAQAAGRYAFQVDAAFASVLSVLDTCGGPELACDDAGFASGETAAVDLLAGQTVVVVVDGEYINDGGDFDLSVFAASAAEGLCADGIDEDVDGDIDCLDSDCAADIACLATCPELSLGASAPATLLGSTLGKTDDGDGNCDGSFGGASDVTVDFTAPVDGTYAFSLDTTDTEFDAVLYATNGCGGNEIACDDAFGIGNGGGELLLLPLVAGQNAVLVVDGYAGGTGTFRLDVAEVAASETACADAFDEDFDGDIDCLDSDCAADVACLAVCPELSLGASAPASVFGSTIGKTDDDDGSCGFTGVAASDVTVDFTAPADGSYVFTLDSIDTDFDAVLYATNGCGGNEIGCDDAFGLGNGGGEQLLLSMVVGQTVILVVDGYAGDSGDFRLDVALAASSETVCADGIDEDLDGDFDCLDSDCAADPTCLAVCPEDTVGALPFNTVGTTLNRTNDFDPACEPTSAASDYTYEFTAPAAATYTISLAGSAYDTVLYVTDTCGGLELDCNDDFFGVQSAIQIFLNAGQTVIIVVDGFGAASGDFVLDIQ